MVTNKQTKSRSYSLIVISIAILFTTLIWGPDAFAQTTMQEEQRIPPILPASIPPANTVDCFSYYRFGSVQANIRAETSSAVSGTPITFTGTLKNDNQYPIVDGALYVKVFRLRNDPSEKNVNGPYVVDQYFVLDGINLPAKGEMPIIFTWDIPSFTKSGQYEVATFFTTSKKYNLLGLTFTDDVVGNRAGFRVSGEVSKNVEFNKDDVTVAGQPYYFATFPPHVDKNTPIEITASVRNSTKSDASASIKWQAYAWDAGSYANLVEKASQSVNIKAGGIAHATYHLKDSKYPVYLVIGTLSWQNTQSIINVRLVRRDIDRARINFPGVMSYPLKSGEETTLFSCLHNTGENTMVPDGRLELRLSDQSGKTIHEYTYTGDVSSAMMGVADKFTPRKTYANFTLDAMLYQGSVLTDEAHLQYNCKDIDTSICPSDKTSFFDFLNTQFESLFTIAFWVIVGLALIAGIVSLQKNTPTQT